MKNSRENSICDVPGIQVGHYTDTRRPTGCTVVLMEDGAVAGIEVRGGAPGTRETDLLDPLNTVEKIHAVLLSGGSAFGLEAASGVVQYLEEKGIGIDTGMVKVPIVSAAVLYDLDLGDPAIRPDRTAGYQACRNASTEPPLEGNCGVGAGATVGKIFGMSRAMKGGLGTASCACQSAVVGALVAVNALGDIYDPDNGRIAAGARNEAGSKFSPAREALLKGMPTSLFFRPQNTTLGVIATNLKLTKLEAAKLARMAQAGLARTIFPVHTPLDGDAVFVLSTGKEHSEVNLIQLGTMAAEALSAAVLRAIFAASSLPGLPAARDFSGA